jgi:hypothetical protein
MLTETKQIEPVVILPEPTWKKENIVERKTIVYETYMDPTVARVAGEKLKKQLFIRYGLFTPRSEEIQFVSMDKYYEPYIVINGRYFIDYFRNRTYVFKVDEVVREVMLLNNKFIPEADRNAKVIKLFGEERLVHETKSFLILDKNGRDAQLDNFSSAPSEKKPEKAIKECGIEELPENTDVDFVRARIARRPEDMSRIVEEIFEVTERTVIYAPRFKVAFKNTRTNEERALVIDGASSKRIG